MRLHAGEHEARLGHGVRRKRHGPSGPPDMIGWLARASHAVALAADAMALVMVALGSVDAFVRGIAVLLRRDGHRERDVWIRFGRWMVAGLGFQLAADIVETSVA